LENKDPGTVGPLSDVLLGLGRDPGEVIARANAPEIREKYTAETEVARAMGVFGSPTFACGQELFWGDDRLEDAIDWCESR
jgi:2-hydroxychromene-2-carboxylate isomerase